MATWHLTYPKTFLIMILFPLFKEKRDDRRKRIHRPKRSVGFALDNNKTQEFKKMDIVQRDDRVIKSAERNVPKTPGRLVKLNQGMVQEPVIVEDAQQSDAASGVDTQSGVGSEVAEEHGEEFGGEAKENFIDEINAKDEEPEERPDSKAEISVLKEVAPQPLDSPRKLKKSSSAPQQFEEESKVHEVELSEEEETSTDHEPKKEVEQEKTAANTAAEKIAE